MPSKIFISYRRDDSADAAGRLSDNLLAHFDKEQIFVDIDYIEPGEDFVQVITDAVSSCQILIAVIGRNWLSSSKDGRTRRLDNPTDFVRLEIATALNLNLRVIPVLVQGATMPAPHDLPDDLVKLSYRNAFEISHTRWKRDAESLISSLRKILDKQQEARRAEEQRQREAKIAADAQRKREEAEAARLVEEERRKQETEKTVHHTKEERQQREERKEREVTEVNRQREQELSGAASGNIGDSQQRIATTAAQSLPPSLPPPPLIATPVATHENIGAPKPIYKKPRAMIVLVAVIISLVALIIFIWMQRTDTNGNQLANENQSSIESQTSPVPPSPTPHNVIAEERTQLPTEINSNVSNSNVSNANVIESNANNSNIIESNANSWLSEAGRKNLTPLRASATTEGSRIMITSDGALNDYSAYRSGDRFYVLIPAAEVPRALSGLRGRGFDDVRVQKRGNDVLFSFRLLSGANARVSQKFNRIEILVTVPSLVTANSAAKSNNANVRKSTPSNGRSSGKQSKPKP